MISLRVWVVPVGALLLGIGVAVLFRLQAQDFSGEGSGGSIGFFDESESPAAAPAQVDVAAQPAAGNVAEVPASSSGEGTPLAPAQVVAQPEGGDAAAPVAAAGGPQQQEEPLVSAAEPPTEAEIDALKKQGLDQFAEIAGGEVKGIDLWEDLYSGKPVTVYVPRTGCTWLIQANGDNPKNIRRELKGCQAKA